MDNKWTIKWLIVNGLEWQRFWSMNELFSPIPAALGLRPCSPVDIWWWYSSTKLVNTHGGNVIYQLHPAEVAIHKLGRTGNDSWRSLGARTWCFTTTLQRMYESFMVKCFTMPEFVRWGIWNNSMLFTSLYSWDLQTPRPVVSGLTATRTSPWRRILREA